MLAAGHVSNLDPWPIGLAHLAAPFSALHGEIGALLVPARSVIVVGGGAFKVNRGQADYAAIDTAVRLAREGNVIAMFPEGTRRRKGLRKTREAMHTPGLRGSRSRRRCRSSRPASRAPTACAGWSRGGCATGSRSSSTISAAELAEAARTATDRLMAAIQALEASL